MLWPEIVEGTHRWRHEARLAATVRELTRDELIRFFDDHIAEGAPHRRKVASHWFSQKDRAAQAAEEELASST